MGIKPIKSVKSVKNSQIEQEDFLQRPTLKKNYFTYNLSQKVSYNNGKILYDGQDALKAITEAAISNPQLLSHIASELEKFKKDTLKRTKKLFFKNKSELSDAEVATILAICDAYITKISELIKNRYDETKDGLSVHFDENGQLLLNGINIHAFVHNSRNHQTDKSQLFLKGIKNRLEFVLKNKTNNRNYDRLRSVILELIEEINLLL